MRHVDFAPLYRSTVGFDRLAALFDQVGGLEGEAGGFPPYNIERVAESAYKITMAVAGFSNADLHIEQKESTLTVRGEKAEEPGDTAKPRQFLHRGIAGRNFERHFQLADFVSVKGAELKDGLLHIDLVRELPERMKPRSIAIGAPVEGKAIAASLTVS